MAERNGWKGWALAAVTGLLVGSGSIGAIGHAQYTALEDRLGNEITKLEERLDTEIEKVEIRNDKDYEVIMEISRAVVRIETKVDGLKSDVDDLQ